MTETSEPNKFIKKSWLQKRESDTESLVTDEVEIRIQDEENTQELAWQSEQNATTDNSCKYCCEETDEIAEQKPSALQIFSDAGVQSHALRAKLSKASTSRMWFQIL